MPSFQSLGRDSFFSAMDGGIDTTLSSPLDVYQNTLLRRRNSISQSVVVGPTYLSSLHQQTSSDASSGTSSSNSSSSTTSTSSASSGEFDLISVKPVSYVSLRDLLPSAAVNSPKPKSPAQNHLQPCSEISIRNRLVKQAAWAYLQPMSIAPDSSTRNFLHRLWDQFTTENPLSALVRFFNRHVFGTINRFFDWLLRSIWVRSSR